MSEPIIPPEWVATLQAWARNERLIEAVYIFGSRAKRTARPDSDLDVAVLLRGSKDERNLNWILNASRWRTSLHGLLPVEVKLDQAD